MKPEDSSWPSSSGSGQGKFDTAVVITLDRRARNIMTLGQILETLSEAQVGVVAIGEILTLNIHVS